MRLVDREVQTGGGDDSNKSFYYPDPIENQVIFSHETRGSGHQNLADAVKKQEQAANPADLTAAIKLAQEKRLALKKVLDDEERAGASIAIKTDHAQVAEEIAQSLSFAPQARELANTQVLLKRVEGQLVQQAEDDQMLLPAEVAHQAFKTTVSQAKQPVKPSRLGPVKDYAVIAPTKQVSEAMMAVEYKPTGKVERLIKRVVKFLRRP